VNLQSDANLVAPKEGIKDEARIRHLVTREGVGLGNATGVWVTSSSYVWVYDVVAKAISGTPGVFVTHSGKGWMGQIILFT